MLKKFAIVTALVIGIIITALPALAQEGLSCDPTVDYMKLGWTQKQAGEAEAALRSFNCGIELETDDVRLARLYYGRGAILCAQGKPDQALENYELAIDADPEYAMAWNNRGWASYLLGNYDVAMESLEKALELDPQNAYAYNNRGLVYLKWGQAEQAMADFQQAIDLGMAQPWAEINIANSAYMID